MALILLKRFHCMPGLQERYWREGRKEGRREGKREGEKEGRSKGRKEGEREGEGESGWCNCEVGKGEMTTLTQSMW